MNSALSLEFPSGHFCCFENSITVLIFLLFKFWIFWTLVFSEVLASFSLACHSPLSRSLHVATSLDFSLFLHEKCLTTWCGSLFRLASLPGFIYRVEETGESSLFLFLLTTLSTLLLVFRPLSWVVIKAILVHQQLSSLLQLWWVLEIFTFASFWLVRTLLVYRWTLDLVTSTSLQPLWVLVTSISYQRPES